MAKRKKTKDQKILAEIRRKEQAIKPAAVTYSLSSFHKQKDQKNTLSANSISVTEHENVHHVFLDLRKTLLATGFIIIIELLIHNFLF